MDGTGIASEVPIGGEKGNALDDGLCDQEPIEQILVGGREMGSVDGMLAGDGKLGVAVVE